MRSRAKTTFSRSPFLILDTAFATLSFQATSLSAPDSKEISPIDFEPLKSEIVGELLSPIQVIQDLSPRFPMIISGITGAENNYFAKSKIWKSDGSWFISETKRSINFRNEVVNSNGNSSVVCHLKSAIKEEQIRESDRDGIFSTKSVKEYPMDIKLDSISEGDLFEFRTDLRLFANENTLIQKKSKKYRKSYENRIYGSGYFGTIRTGKASHKQNLRFRSPEKCYSRFLTASNRSIVSDHTSHSCNNINYF